MCYTICVKFKSDNSLISAETRVSAPVCTCILNFKRNCSIILPAISVMVIHYDQVYHCAGCKEVMDVIVLNFVSNFGEKKLQLHFIKGVFKLCLDERFCPVFDRSYLVNLR